MLFKNRYSRVLFTLLSFLFIQSFTLVGQNTPSPNLGSDNVTNGSAGTNPCGVVISGPDKICITKNPATYNATVTKCNDNNYVWTITDSNGNTDTKTTNVPTLEYTYAVVGQYTVEVSVGGSSDSMTTLVFDRYLIETDKKCFCYKENFDAWVVDCNNNRVQATFIDKDFIDVIKTSVTTSKLRAAKHGSAYILEAKVNGETISATFGIDVVRITGVTASRTVVLVGSKVNLTATLKPESTQCEKEVSWTAVKGTFNTNTGTEVIWTAPADINGEFEDIVVTAGICRDQYTGHVNAASETIRVIKPGTDKLILKLEPSEICTGETSFGTAYKQESGGQPEKTKVYWTEDPFGHVEFSNGKTNQYINQVISPVSRFLEHGDKVKITINKAEYESASETLTIYKHSAISGPGTLCADDIQKFKAVICESGDYTIKLLNGPGIGSIKEDKLFGNDIRLEISFSAEKGDVFPFYMKGIFRGQTYIQLLKGSEEQDTKPVEIVSGVKLKGDEKICKDKWYPFTATVCEEGTYNLIATPGTLQLLPNTLEFDSAGTKEFWVKGTALGNHTITISKDDSAEILDTLTTKVQSGIIVNSPKKEHCIHKFSENCWKITGEVCPMEGENQINQVFINFSDETKLTFAKGVNNPITVKEDGTFSFKVEALDNGDVTVTASGGGLVSEPEEIKIEKVEYTSQNNTEGEEWVDIEHIVYGPFFEDEPGQTVQIEIKPEMGTDLEVEKWVMTRYEKVGEVCGRAQEVTLMSDGGTLSNGDKITPNEKICDVVYTKSPRFRYIIMAYVKCPGSDEVFRVPHYISTSIRETKVIPFAPNSKFRNVTIHGQPSTALRPQENQEKDQAQSKFTIDAYHMSATYSTTDVSIPLRGSELSLEFRRTSASDVEYNNICTINNIYDPWKNIVGYGWRTNLTARVKVTDEGYSVVDDGGGTYQYDLTFKPKKDTFSNHEASHHSLTKLADGSLKFRKRYGTVYIFTPVSVSDGGINGSGGGDDPNGPQCPSEQGNERQPGSYPIKAHWRIASMTDRNGNSIIYKYESGLLFPVEIYYEQQPELFIKINYENGRLSSIEDPEGRIFNYEFNTSGQLHKVIMPPVPVWNSETQDTTIERPENIFGYTILSSTYGTVIRKYTCLSSVTDAENNNISMSYRIVNQHTEDAWVGLSSITSPDGTANFATNGANQRVNTITDTKGNSWRYAFTTSTVPILLGYDEFVLNNFQRTLNNDLSMSATFDTDVNSGAVNLSLVTDYHGNTCHYIYGTQNVSYKRNGNDVIDEPYNFSANGQPYQEIIDQGGLSITKQFGYENSASQMVSIVDPRGFEVNDISGFTTIYDLDDNGNRIAEHAPEGKITRFTYELGYQTKAIDADGRTTLSKRFYHENGWDDVSVVLLNYGDARTYDELGIDYSTYTASVEDDIILTVKKCDLVGNVRYIIDANGNETENIYDNLNGLTITTLPEVFDYDSSTNTNPQILLYRDKNRQVVAKQDARGSWTYSSYDAMLRPTVQTVKVSANQAEDIVTVTEYDVTGNKRIFTDARGVKYFFVYDSFNNLIQEVKDANPAIIPEDQSDLYETSNSDEYLELISSYVYGDNSGNDLFGDSGFVPTQKTDPRGLVTLLEYDNAYRLKGTKRGPAGSEVLLSEIDYDHAGNVVKTTTYNNKVSDLNGNYVDDTNNIISGNQETVTKYDKLNRPTHTAVDLDGDGASITDADDILTQTFYDKAGNVVKVIDPEGHSTQTQYDAAGRVVRQVVNLDYNEATKVDNPAIANLNGNPYTIVVAAEDIETTKFYDDNSNVLEETIINDTVGAVGEQTVSKEYDALNRVSSVTDPLDNVTETKYDLNNNVRWVKNARGFETITEYDEANRAFRQTLPQVYDAESEAVETPVVTTFFDTNSNVIETVDARGLHTVNIYDALNRLEETRQVVGANDTDEGSNENDDIVTTNEYDDNNNLISTTFTRNDIDPDTNQPVNVDLVTSTQYDSLDRPLVTTDPEGFQSVVFCDLVGNKIKLFDKRANSMIVGGVETPQETPQLRYFTLVKFDLANRMVKNTLPEIPVASRNILGDVNETNQQPFSEVKYLKNNWVIETKDLNGNITTTDYDGAGRKERITTAINQITEYVYDKSSNVLEQKVFNDAANGGDQVTRYEYDKRNLLLKEKLNEGDVDFARVYEYSYDANGNKQTRKFPNGHITTYSYDALDRLTNEVYTGAESENREYKYNLNGAVVLATDATGQTDYEYDILGRQIKETKKDSSGVVLTVVESVFDKANNRIRCYFPNDKKTLVSFYDKRNLLKIMKGYHGKVADESAYTGVVEQTTYSYNANGQQVSLTTPNTQTTTKTYDNADRILSSTTTANNQHIYTVNYKRDAVGNQLQAVETRYDLNGDRVRTLNFEYDAVYRLTKETDNVSGSNVSTEYQFDLQGNRLNKIVKDANGNEIELWTYTNDILNRTTKVEKKENNVLVKTYDYQYDLNGNRELKTETDNLNGSVVVDHTYNYDRENRLKSVEDPAGDIFTASYDYRTRRVTKAEGTSAAQNTLKATTYIYDGGVTCQETEDVNGTEMLVKQYIRGNGMGGGIGSVLYMERRADYTGTTQAVQDFYDNLGYGPTSTSANSNTVAEYYAYNAVGSVVANTDQQGFVIRENDFDAYGNQVREQDWTSDNFPTEFGVSQNDLLFSTKERDFSTGLDYFGFRYYDAVLGKFTTRDPSGYPDGPNNYLYVNNNPINSIDPLGLENVRLTAEEIAQAQKYATHMASIKGSNMKPVAGNVNPVTYKKELIRELSRALRHKQHEHDKKSMLIDQKYWEDAVKRTHISAGEGIVEFYMISLDAVTGGGKATAIRQYVKNYVKNKVKEYGEDYVINQIAEQTGIDPALIEGAQALYDLKKGGRKKSSTENSAVDSNAGGGSGTTNGIPDNPGEVRRFTSKEEYKKLKKEGQKYDPNDTRGGLSTTSTKIKPKNPDALKNSTGANHADYYVDINTKDKNVKLKGKTKGGVVDYKIKDDINPEDITGGGKVKKK